MSAAVEDISEHSSRSSSSTARRLSRSLGGAERSSSLPSELSLAFLERLPALVKALLRSSTAVD